MSEEPADPINDLDKEFESSDIGKTTFRNYFQEILCKLIYEGEGFSGKRPFGNSGWMYDLGNGLAESGILKAEKNKWDEYDLDFGDISQTLYAMIAKL